MKSEFLQELKWRGMIKDISPSTEVNLPDAGMFSGYIGFDPTAASLHVGNLCAIMLLKQLQLAGHKPIILLGGFTGHIGDPAGKVNERKLLSSETVQANLAGLKAQFSRFLDFDCGDTSAEIVNNDDWLSKISLTDFLRDVGKYMSVNYMLAKDSVKSRLDAGISFTEFTYQLFQAYDFYWLYKNNNCRLQMGGSDQWGNITGGIELIRKVDGGDVFALTTPLLLKSDGGKFGKSEEGNIWLDPQLTSPYKFYQFWLNVDDAQLGQLLRVFTLFTRQEIEELEIEFSGNPNQLKRILAKELTVRVHSSEIFRQVEKASGLLFSDRTLEDFEVTDEPTISDIFQGLPKSVFDISDYHHTDITYLFSKVFGISKSEIKRLIENKGLSINKTKISGPVPSTDFGLLKNRYLLLQKGKSYGLARFE